MSLKEFIKPNKWKIILFFIIGTISLYIEFISYCFGPGPGASIFACLSTFSSILYVLLTPFLVLGRLIIIGSGFGYLILTILLIILQIFYTYVISSLIVSIFSKKSERIINSEKHQLYLIA